MTGEIIQDRAIMLPFMGFPAVACPFSRGLKAGQINGKQKQLTHF